MGAFQKVLVFLLSLEGVLCGSPELFVVSDGKGKVSCVAVGGDVDSAIFWQPPLEKLPSKDPLPFSSDWLKGWNVTSSLSARLDPVKDRRWEDFPLYNVTNTKLKFLTSIRNSAAFSVCTTSPIVAIALKNSGNSLIYYKIVIRNGKGTTAEKCRNKNDCTEIPTFVNQTLSYDEKRCDWIHLLIISQNGTTELVHESKTLVKFKHDVPFNRVFGTAMGPSLWKVHKYNFTSSSEPGRSSVSFSYSGRLCLSMYVTLCADCILEATLESSGASVTKKIAARPAIWEKISLEIESFNTATLELLRRSSGAAGARGFWGIDGIKFCPKREAFKARLPTSQGNSSYECGVLEDGKSRISVKPNLVDGDKSVPFCRTLGKLGRRCNVTCASVMGGHFPKCEDHVVCQRDSGCACSWGYRYSNGACLKRENALKPIEMQIAGARDSMLFLKWDSPVDYDIDDYIITYQQYKPPNATLSAKNETLKTPYTNVTIEDLQPFSKYVIRIFQVVGDHDPGEVSYTTDQASIGPEELPKSVFVDPHGTLQLELPLCGDSGGDIVYNLEYKCESEWCNRDPPMKNEKKLNCGYNTESYGPAGVELLPYTEYSVAVQAGRFGRNVSKEYPTFRTPSGVPNVVRNLTVYSRHNNTLWVRWREPYPPTGRVVLYLVQYRKSAEEALKKGGSVVPCRLWDGFQCSMVTGLNPKTEYEIKVSAQNEGVKGEGKAESVRAVTGQSASQKPEDLRLVWSSGLLARWRHPSIFNGPLKYFAVKIARLSPNAVTLEERVEIAKYQKEYELPVQLQFWEEYNISVNGVNQYEGEASSLVARVIPPFLELSSVPLVESCGKTCRLAVPKVEGNRSVSNFYALVPSGSSAYSDDEVRDLVQELRDKAENEGHQHKLMLLRPDEDEEIETGALDPGRNRTFRLVLTTGEGGTVVYPSVSPPAVITGTASTPFIIAMVLVALVCATAVMVNLVYRYNYGKFPFKYRKITYNLDDSNHFDRISYTNAKLEEPSKVEEPVQSVALIKAKFEEQQWHLSRAVDVEDLESYIMSSLEGGPYENELTKQYEMLSQSVLKPCSAARYPINKNKNRYPNFVPYDTTRVVLLEDALTQGDYINANYVDGYQQEKAYIATQAPLPTTIGDFWRMVVQENVSTIVMVTNLVEDGKKKCEQYWPDINSKAQYGKVFVALKGCTIFADHVYRQLEVSYRNEFRMVRHFHFIAWPDLGVPSDPRGLAPFMKQLVMKPHKNGPVVVHCSAGIGRTGTVILTDIALRMALKEGKVDFVSILAKMRQQRVKLVSTSDQYIFAHFLVLECLFGLDFSIRVDDRFREKTEQVLWKTTVRPLMEHLDKFTTLMEKMRENISSPPLTAEEKARNRFSNEISDSRSSSIHPVSVDSLHCLNRYIVVERPLLSNSVGDLWRLILEYNIDTIVSLNDTNPDNTVCAPFWPTPEEEFSFRGFPIMLKHLHERHHEFFGVTKLKMVIDEKSAAPDTRLVKVIQMKGWKSQRLVPANVRSLISMWKEIMYSKTWGRNNQIVVTCCDGTTASGLFVALSLLLEKINVERICDVFLAAKTVKKSRKQFVQNRAQFEYLYKSALEYLKNFQEGFTTGP